MSHYEHTDAKKHANRSFDEKDTSTDRFALYAKKKAIGLIYFNFINSYIRYFINNIK